MKYACKGCEEHVALAPKPPQPIEKGVPAPGLCARVVLSKFGDHLPLYREEDLSSRAGWLIRRSTICGWLYDLAILAEPLVMRMKHLILQSKVIHTDDTKIKMIEPQICREAKFWPYQGDWQHPYVVYDFTLDRSRNGPQKFLTNYQGYLQADAFSGYDCVYTSGAVKEVACWVHTRRYWYDALELDAVVANTALGFIARLTQVESQLRQSYPPLSLQGERDFVAIAAARQQHSVPILTEFKAWLDEQLNNNRILPKSNLRSAFTYTLNQWTRSVVTRKRVTYRWIITPRNVMQKWPRSVGRIIYSSATSAQVRTPRSFTRWYVVPKRTEWSRSHGCETFTHACRISAAAKRSSKRHPANPSRARKLMNSCRTLAEAESEAGLGDRRDPS